MKHKKSENYRASAPAMSGAKTQRGKHNPIFTTKSEGHEVLNNDKLHDCSS